MYVAPCAYEDLLKLGFSRDPLDRLRSLHRRYFEVFDLGRAMLVETETVRDARAIELRLRRELGEHNAPAPLVMREEAGGASEWYRGAYGRLDQAVLALEAGGHRVHRPADTWFRAALTARSDLLYAWTLAVLPTDPVEAGDPRACALVSDALDACGALGIDLEPRLPPAVLAWHRQRGGRG
ncbi:hypothetical protein GCM10007067_02930 [Lysobacter bugurensis]|uniref:Bacteriophage T5 Orf172 DNA-binding domain-containing protein n=1 Tax=Cognatilysobacter bugurensis TaxID=543356 RepID=A0A918SSY7_9GAMM|nr:hypothetical protein GCM10007067_02930 [Lysobacter bugurensis]